MQGRRDEKKRGDGRELGGGKRIPVCILTFSPE